ncbi:MAG: hypothetical protein ATN33_07830 [Epulopiscium sp. Nele67-Bin001]|nr:MAG: hypothetical protein ATN33_07830 [Epulopiscium sp. Nele67-Bin001]
MKEFWDFGKVVIIAYCAIQLAVNIILPFTMSGIDFVGNVGSSIVKTVSETVGNISFSGGSSSSGSGSGSSGNSSSVSSSSVSSSSSNLEAVETMMEIEQLIVAYDAPFYTDRGIMDTNVQIPYDEQKIQYLSRDGSKSELITQDTLVTLPGKYFLSVTDMDNDTTVLSFEIPNDKSDNWVVKNEDEIPEIIKQELFDLATDVKITLSKRYDDIDYLLETISNQITEILDTYPTIAFTTFKIEVAISYSTEINITFSYPDLELLRTYNAEWEDVHEEILNTVMDKSMDSYEREFAIFSYIIDSVTYDPNGRLGLDYVQPMQHTLYGASIENLAVCDGYAKMFMYILNSVGVPTTYIVGDALGTPHAWNLVQIDGQSYHVDATWADQDELQIGSFLDYFNENDEYMSNTHTWDDSLYSVSTSDEYNLINLDLGIDQLYTLNSMDELAGVLEIVQVTEATAFSLILSPQLSDSSSEILTEVANLLNQSISYNQIQKTNQVVLNIEFN